MTGVDIWRNFQREIFKSYSVYYSNTKGNDLFQKALVTWIEEQYDNLTNQSFYDDLLGVIVLGAVFIPNNNKIYTSNIDIVNVTNSTTIITVTTALPHNIIVGDSVSLINIGGIVTVPVINSIFVVTAITANTFTFNVATYTSGTYIAGTGQVSGNSLNGVSKMVTDYNHLLSLKAKFYQQLTYQVSSISETQPIGVTLTSINNNIVTKDKINVSGILGNTNANGDFYVNKVNRKTFNLFYDQDRTKATTGNGSFGGLATLKRIFYEYCTAWLSHTKISKYDDPKVDKPKFERGDKMLQVAPYDYVCAEITMDYISNALVYIDITDNSIDLTDTYPLDFLYQVIAKAKNLFAAEVKDPSLYQSSENEIKESNR